MKNVYDLNLFIEKYADLHQGIFTVSDLKNLFNDSNPVSLYRKIRALEEKGILRKFSRGFYTTSHANLEMLSALLNPESYISFGNALSRELVIGSVPEKRIMCVKPGKKREYKNEQGTIVFLSISPYLFFGFRKTNGINYADKEKAFLDALYFYQKGQKFSFNIFHDVNISIIDKEKALKYLKRYRNPKFKIFVQSFINEFGSI